ncbi:MAG: glutaredoxin 3 [SAR86 cluster bacterium]|uniref:Glutaredoxin n=1 Tax=SAR86 cluster bacterium TaxID=2030880 RepID=A0A2A5B8R7_9GAMM|nr:MAG: glutaredoxin 3 [SAR86 cluster bacterium]
MPDIKIYTSTYCAYCTAAKNLLSSKGYKFEEINMQGNSELMIEVMQKSGQRTVPQIFIGEHSVGGYQELLAATVNGEFSALLEQ